MGRWAQNRSRGGGAEGRNPNVPTAAFLIDPNIIQVNWSEELVDPLPDPAWFEAQPPFINAIAVNQTAPNVLEVDFGADVSAATEIAFISGSDRYTSNTITL